MTFEEVKRRLAAVRHTDGQPSPRRQDTYTVIWDGRGELLPDRTERRDGRFSTMPSLDWSDDPVSTRPKRKYTRTGRYRRKEHADVHNTNKPESK